MVASAAGGIARFVAPQAPPAGMARLRALVGDVAVPSDMLDDKKLVTVTLLEE